MDGPLASPGEHGSLRAPSTEALAELEAEVAEVEALLAAIEQAADASGDEPPPGEAGD